MRNISFSNLDLLSINILVHLYEGKSATYVSQKLDIPAPKISRCLKHAREVFGNELFTRKKYGLIPNEFAGKIYPLAKKIIECCDGLQQIFDEKTFESAHHFEIASPDLISYKLPKSLLNAIKDTGKEISFNISPWTKNSLKSIIDIDADIGLCCSSSIEAIEGINRNIKAIHLLDLEQLYLICHNNHPVLKTEITLESISEYPFINANIGNIHGYENSFKHYCKNEGIQLRVEVEDICLAGLLEYLRTSNGVTLLPYSSIYNMINNIHDLHACKLSDVESQRLFINVPTPSLYLIYNTENIKPDLLWIANNIKFQVESALI